MTELEPKFQAELNEIFRDEAIARLDQMDIALLGVESGEAGAETIDALFRHAHTIKGSAAMLGFDDIRVLGHAMEDVLASVREAGVFPPELAAPLLRATAALRAHVGGAEDPFDDLLDDLQASRAVRPGDEARVAGPPEPGPGVLSRPRAVRSGPGPNRGPEPAVAHGASVVPGAAAGRTLRVPAEQIDHLLDVLGEVIQHRSRLAHSLRAEPTLPPEVSVMLGIGDTLFDDLKDTAVGMRTLPLAVITGPLPRAVRDLAHATGKAVELVVTGAETVIDRVILESLSEPLAHLLRNAVLHGIESPAERERAGKPRQGRVEVRAVPRGSLVEVAVVDDGRGVTPEVIAEARREGALADVLSRAGYSTAEEVTDLAGRGVGLDAVKTYVESLGGALEVRSEPGQGMEVILLLPLALALLNVLIFERGGAVYGVPLAVVEEAVLVSDTVTLESRRSVAIRGRTLPVTDFAALVGAAAPSLAERSPALVISVGGRRVVAACDVLRGEEEVVVKPLGPLFDNVGGYLGAAILGDSRIALLVEPATLTRRPRGAPGPAPAAAGPLAHPRILVVEDSFTVRELQRSILEAAGYPVVTARDGREALVTLARDAEIALVITDFDMPELGGLELTRAIRGDPAHPSLPVVIVTSRASEDDRRRGIEAGADAYMAKGSFDQQALLATVERLVGR
jgi:two-component system, chemotaxis family, sensor kinase CheA